MTSSIKKRSSLKTCIYLCLGLGILASPGAKSYARDATSTDTTPKPSVVCYTRSGITPKQGNALHLGISEDGVHYTALNNDVCVLALRKAVDEPQLSEKEKLQGIMKTLSSPYLFRMENGDFGVAVLRTDQNGRPDSTVNGAFLLVTSKNLVDYSKERLCFIPVTDAIDDLSVEFDRQAKKYRVTWMSQGKIQKCSTSDFKKFSRPEPAARLDGHDARLHQDRFNFNNANFGNAIEITPEEYGILKSRLGRIVNTGVEPIDIKISRSDIPGLSKKRAVMTYNDGSTKPIRVKWNEHALENLRTAPAGTYDIDGEVIQYDFTYPVSMSNCADPDVIYYKGAYYMVYTFEHEWNQIFIRKSDTLDGLTDGNRPRWKETRLVGGPGVHWAPELHVIGGKLYMLLAIGGENGLQAYMMRLNDGGDPASAEDWSKPFRVLLADGTPLKTDPKTQGVTLDMTYFEDGGKSYLCWSDRKVNFLGNEAVDPGPVLSIATVDPEEPWKLTSDHYVIGDEAFSWCFCKTPLQLAEGPFRLPSDDDNVYLTYSGGGVTGGNYEVGLLTARKGSNLLDASSWYNSPRPWMTNNSPIAQVGPGHNSYLRDEYGDLYNVYHSGHRYRHTSICPVHFRADGSPVLDMAPWEEVDPNYRKVKMSVTITD